MRQEAIAFVVRQRVENVIVARGGVGHSVRLYALRAVGHKTEAQWPMPARSFFCDVAGSPRCAVARFFGARSTCVAGSMSALAYRSHAPTTGNFPRYRRGRCVTYRTVLDALL